MTDEHRIDLAAASSILGGLIVRSLGLGAGMGLAALLAAIFFSG